MEMDSETALDLDWESEDEKEDLEELEALLYSQIYYDTTEQSEENGEFTVNNSNLNSSETSKILDSECQTPTSIDSGFQTPKTIDSDQIISRPPSSNDELIEQNNLIRKLKTNLSNHDTCDSKYDQTEVSSSSTLVENPFFDSSEESDSDDDGIIVLPSEKKPTEVIDLDSSSNMSSALSIPDVESNQSNDCIQVTIHKQKHIKYIKI